MVLKNGLEGTGQWQKLGSDSFRASSRDSRDRGPNQTIARLGYRNGFRRASAGECLFFGMRLVIVGTFMSIGWLVAAFLLALAIGVWRMRRYASLMAECYAVYVLLDVVIFTAIHPLPKTHAELMFAVMYETIAVAGAWILAILLRRERAQLT
jgi:hypothetical protein